MNWRKVGLSGGGLAALGLLLYAGLAGKPGPVFAFDGRARPQGIADICDLVPSLEGPSAFCLRPDGGSVALQADAGATQALTVVGAPVSTSFTQLPCGSNGCSVVRQVTNGNDGWDTAAIAAPVRDMSACWYGSLDNMTGVQQLIAKDLHGAGNRAFYMYLNAGSSVGFSVFGTGDTSTDIAVTGSPISAGSPSLICFTYNYVADNTSIFRAYINGVAAGTPSTTARGPIQPTTGVKITVNHRYYAGNFNFLSGGMQGAFITETVLTAAQIQAVAQSLGVYAPTTLQGTRGEAMTFTRASVGSCLDSTGTAMTILASGRPCATGGGYLSEPAASNYLFQSQALATTWNTLGTVVAAPTRTNNTTDVVAIDGTYTATKIDFPATTAATNVSVVYQGQVLAPGSFTYSYWIKAASPVTLTVAHYGATGFAAAPIATNQVSVTTTWQRVTRTSTRDTNNFLTFGPERVSNNQGDTAAMTVYVWGVQWEAGSVATSYIPTGAAAVTRAATSLTVANPLYGTTPAAWCIGGTVTPQVAAGAWTGGLTQKGIAQLGTTINAANSASLWYHSNGRLFMDVRDSSAGYVEIQKTAIMSNGTHTIYGCVNSGVPSLWVDGALAASTTSGAGTGIISTQPATAMVGTMGSTYELSGTISDVKILNRGTP
jgi:hypothetical protein